MGSQAAYLVYIALESKTDELEDLPSFFCIFNYLSQFGIFVPLEAAQMFNVLQCFQKLYNVHAYTCW